MILLSGAVFALLAAACFSFRNEDHVRWEWLAVFALLYCLHQWLELIGLMVGLPYQTQIGNLLLVISMIGLLEFCRSNYARLHPPVLPRWLSLGLLVPALAAALLLPKENAEIAILQIGRAHV